MNKLRNIETASPNLQQYVWPPVEPFQGFSLPLKQFLERTRDEKRRDLEGRRCDRERSGGFLHQALGAVYAYQYGYHDSACYLSTDDMLETQLLEAKILLERELMEHWLPTKTPVQMSNQEAAADYLRGLASNNGAVDHPLYDWLADEAPAGALLRFLDDDVIRNEVVDDEVALLVCGHQGLLKNMAGINLADELGRGKLNHAHTYWLRIYLEQTNGWERLLRHRMQDRPWFCSIMSNVFNMTLLRPGLKFAAYGHFLMTEALVCPHFERLLEGMRRLNLCQGEANRYFSAHCKLDPYHAEEMITGIALQQPALQPEELDQMILGAHWAIAGAMEQYGRVERQLKALARI